ncbi:MAG: hypothetical protein IJ415_04750 [Clostridia bacterium]|nr:hypothetical protein [Clostridia bacterium]
MKSQTKVKSVILLAIVILIALFGLVGFQLFKIIQANNKIESQQQQIANLQQQVDYYNNKSPNSNHEIITGENQ